MTSGKRKPKAKRLTILVSSTVYGSEDLLDLIYALLTEFGYDVWMSHKGTVPVFSHLSAFDNCLAAVDECDLFFSLITKQYGTGKEAPGELSITHRELRRAIELDKPRWALAHHDVVFARNLLAQLGYVTSEQRATLTVEKKTPIDDLRVIDMYEEATRNEEKNIADRKGNWVQKYRDDDEAALFGQAQFHRYQEVKSFVDEHFENMPKSGPKA